jgi:hypothetical protein
MKEKMIKIKYQYIILFFSKVLKKNSAVVSGAAFFLKYFS